VQTLINTNIVGVHPKLYFLLTFPFKPQSFRISEWPLNPESY